MSFQSQIIQIKEFLDPAQSILVLISADADLDTLAASSALFLSLEKAGKDVIFVSPDLPTNVDENIVGLDRVRTEISNKNLIMSFNYDETAVEKVSYHIGEETNRFYLTVQPKKGHQPLDKDSVEVGYVGAEADLIFMIGVHNYESLDHLYIGNEQFFTDTTVVAINNFEASVGDVKLNTSESLNMSSAVAEIIRQANLEISGDGATNLLLSIEEVTDSFRSLSITPELLETAAWLMRKGARRVRRTKDTSQIKPVKTKGKANVEVAKLEKKVILKKKGRLDHQPGLMGKSS
jgi:hypothetical protein